MTNIAHTPQLYKTDRVTQVTQRLITAGVTFSFRHYLKDGKTITEFHSHDVNAKKTVSEFDIRLDDRQQPYMWLEVKHDR